jgi:hypothetical protein
MDKVELRVRLVIDDHGLRSCQAVHHQFDAGGPQPSFSAFDSGLISLYLIAEGTQILNRIVEVSIMVCRFEGQAHLMRCQQSVTLRSARTGLRPEPRRDE